MLLAISFGCVMLVGVGAFATLDQILKLLRERHPADWEAMGRPDRIFTQTLSKDVRPSQPANYSLHVLMFRCLFSTPAWAASELDTRRLLVRLRVLVGLLNLGTILTYLFLFPHGGS